MLELGVREDVTANARHLPGQRLVQPGVEPSQLPRLRDELPQHVGHGGRSGAAPTAQHLLVLVSHRLGEGLHVSAVFLLYLRPPLQDVHQVGHLLLLLLQPDVETLLLRVHPGPDLYDGNIVKTGDTTRPHGVDDDKHLVQVGVGRIEIENHLSRGPSY